MLSPGEIASQAQRRGVGPIPQCFPTLEDGFAASQVTFLQARFSQNLVKFELLGIFLQPTRGNLGDRCGVVAILSVF